MNKFELQSCTYCNTGFPSDGDLTGRPRSPNVVRVTVTSERVASVSTMPKCMNIQAAR